MLNVLLLVGLALGPLLLARSRHFPPAPGGIVVSPTAPTLDMRVEYDADDPRSKPLTATLTGQRPQPSNAPDARVVVSIEPQVQLATPEALDRIAAVADSVPHIAVYPWQKTAERAEALNTFFSLLEAMTLTPKDPPTALVVRANGHDGPPVIYFGGHVVVERPEKPWTRRERASDPLRLVLALCFFAAVSAAVVQLAFDPSWLTFGMYVLSVFAISLCIRQIGKYTRLATLVYPISLAWFVIMTFAGKRSRTSAPSVS